MQKCRSPILEPEFVLKRAETAQISLQNPAHNTLKDSCFVSTHGAKRSLKSRQDSWPCQCFGTMVLIFIFDQDNVKHRNMCHLKFYWDYTYIISGPNR